MDEPFGALDAQTRTIMQEDLSGMFLTKKEPSFLSPTAWRKPFTWGSSGHHDRAAGKDQKGHCHNRDNLIPNRRQMRYDDVVSLKEFLDLKAELWGLIKAEILEKHIL